MRGIHSLAVALCCLALLLPLAEVRASGGSGGGGGGSTETIKVTKCFYTSTGGYGEMLVMASSSNTSAHLYLYLPSGTYLGEVRNGGGGRYGGSTFLTGPTDPRYVVIVSSSGARVTAPTTPFQL
ncbi:MAG TPA: hypothetical protein VGN26_07785 [Armatimonadota bacterium]|jgi:hypothetical protein